MKIIILAIVSLLAVVGVVSFVRKDNPPEIVNTLVQKKEQIAAKLSPFSELTIPFLRNRTYTSQLGELTKYKESATYTSYLTSFKSDGLKVNGLLTIPKDKLQKHPAIVFVHGYIAPTIYKTTERYVEYVDYLARNGFVVFKIDLRGNGNSEGEPGGAYYSSDYIIDTLNAYSALQNAEFVDATAVGLWGHSMAGNVVMRSFVVKPEIPAVVVWAGAGYTYSDLSEYRINDQSYRPPATDSARVRKQQEIRTMYGVPNAESPYWSQVAVTNYLKDIKGALEIHHAVDDTVVSIEYSRNLNMLLNKTNVTHEFFEYPSGGHNITGSSFSKAMLRTVEFYKKYL